MNVDSRKLVLSQIYILKLQESDSKSSSSSSEEDEEQQQPKKTTAKVQITKNKDRAKAKDSEYIVTPDNYFLMNSTKKVNKFKNHAIIGM